jgi:hypothetical protein
LESALQWYIWAGQNMHWSCDVVDKMSLAEFFDIVVLYDKMQNPDNYTPAEDIFRMP